MVQLPTKLNPSRSKLDTTELGPPGTQMGPSQYNAPQFSQLGIPQLSQLGAQQLPQLGSQMSQFSSPEFSTPQYGTSQLSLLGPTLSQFGSSQLSQLGRSELSQLGGSQLSQLGYRSSQLGSRSSQFDALKMGTSKMPHSRSSQMSQFGSSLLSQSSQMGAPLISQLGASQLGTSQLTQMGIPQLSQMSQMGISQLAQQGVPQLSQLSQLGIPQLSQSGMPQLAQLGMQQLTQFGIPQLTQTPHIGMLQSMNPFQSLSIGEDLENWMQKLPPLIKNRPLIHLAIPGSHNSATYTITRRSQIAPDNSNTIRNFGKIFRTIVKRIIFNWSVTQNYTISDQLKNGIRYIDLRIATKYPDPNLYIVHGLYGEEVGRVLKDINTFLSSHPEEVVLIDFQHFYAFSVNDHNTLISLIIEKFGSKLCLVPFNKQSLTLNWMHEKKYQVIAIYRNRAGAGTQELCPPSAWPSPWPDTTSVPTLFDCLEESVMLRSENSGLVSQCILTPDVKFVTMHVFSNLENTCGNTCNQAIIPWLSEQNPGPKGINVAIFDFIDPKGIALSKTVISLNTKLITGLSALGTKEEHA